MFVMATLFVFFEVGTELLNISLFSVLLRVMPRVSMIVCDHSRKILSTLAPYFGLE